MSDGNVQGLLIILLAITVIFIILVSAPVLFDELLPLFEQVVDARAHGCGVGFLADVLVVKLIIFISELLKA